MQPNARGDTALERIDATGEAEAAFGDGGLDIQLLVSLSSPSPLLSGWFAGSLNLTTFQLNAGWDSRLLFPWFATMGAKTQAPHLRLFWAL